MPNDFLLYIYKQKNDFYFYRNPLATLGSMKHNVIWSDPKPKTFIIANSFYSSVILIANFVLVYLADLSRSISIAAAHSVANHGRLVIDGTYNKRGLSMILWLDSHFNISWWNFESRWQCVSFRRSNFHFKCSLQCSCRRASNPSTKYCKKL